MSTDLTSDRNFDDLAKRFTKTIYNTARGRLRLRALQADFNDFSLPSEHATVMDMGGGQGQFSLWLALQGASINLCDISAEMLSLADNRFKRSEERREGKGCRAGGADPRQHL